MIAAFLAAKGFLGLKNGIWLVILAAIAAVAFTVIAIADNAVEDTLKTAKDSGAAEAAVAGQRDILSQVERANNAEQEIIRSGDDARYARCLRNATPSTIGNCERFRTMPD